MLKIVILFTMNLGFIKGIKNLAVEMIKFKLKQAKNRYSRGKLTFVAPSMS